MFWRIWPALCLLPALSRPRQTGILGLVQSLVRLKIHRPVKTDK